MKPLFRWFLNTHSHQEGEVSRPSHSSDVVTITPPTVRQLGKNDGDEADDDWQERGDAIASRRRSQLIMMAAMKRRSK